MEPVVAPRDTARSTEFVPSPVGKTRYCPPFTCRELENLQIEVKGVCLPHSSIGASCEVDEQCQGGSSCQDSVCECPDSHDVIDEQCVKRSSRPATTCPIPGQVSPSPLHHTVISLGPVRGPRDEECPILQPQPRRRLPSRLQLPVQ